jgi:hypothetical protein
LKIPIERVVERLYQRGYCDADGYPLSFKQYTPYDDADIVNHFNSVYRGLLNYYSGAPETNSKSRIRYILRFSCAKTLAHKHKSTINKIFKKHGKSLTITGQKVNPKTLKTINRSISFIPASDIPTGWQVSNKHNDPFKIMLGKYSRTKLFSNCYICGSSDTINQHHIKSIKGIKPLTFDQLHGYINRKQIPLCRKHHDDVTFGRYNGIPLNELIERIDSIKTETGNGFFESTRSGIAGGLSQKINKNGKTNKRHTKWQCTFDGKNRSYTSNKEQ